ncbi:MAG: elongation factor Ts [Planctomycetota bacterium]|jgi:elongation factor Ts
MAEITAKLVRDLREKTGAGMMDCKKALSASDGDFEVAVDHLRKLGLKAAGKKAGRTTGEGRVLARIGDDGHTGVMVAVSCETDFVARTPDFEAFLNSLCDHVAEHGTATMEELAAQPWAGEGDTVDDAVKTTIGKLGENIQVAQVARFECSDGQVCAYVHHDDKKGAIVGVKTESDKTASEATLRDLCMHIVVFNPDGVNRDEISDDLVARERAIFLDEVKGKPEEIQEKIITGKLAKFYEANVLAEQKWVKDDKMTVQKAIEKSLGAGSKIASMMRFEVGQS